MPQRGRGFAACIDDGMTERRKEGEVEEESRENVRVSAPERARSEVGGRRGQQGCG